MNTVLLSSQPPRKASGAVIKIVARIVLILCVPEVVVAGASNPSRIGSSVASNCESGHALKAPGMAFPGVIFLGDFLGYFLGLFS
jgi:hypothetical protein